MNDQINDRLRELIEHKEFDALSIEEEQFVLSLIGETAYRKRRQFIINAKQTLKSEATQLKADESIRSNVLAAIRTRNVSQEEEEEEQSTLGFFAIQIPLWTAVAAVFMIFLLSTPLVFDNSLKENRNNTLLTSVDTVYIDKIIRDTVSKIIEIEKPTDTIVKIVYLEADRNTSIDLANKKREPQRIKVSKENHSFPKGESADIPQELKETLIIGGYPSQFDFRNTNTGKSLSSDPIGKRVLGVLK